MEYTISTSVKKLIALCSVALLGLGCDSDSSSSTSGNVIMPLAIGNKWCDATEWYTDGILDTTINGCYRLTEAEQIDSLICYREEYGVTTGFTRYYSNRSDGLWLVSCRGIIGGCLKRLYIPYPATVGTALEPDTSIYRQIDSSNGGWREYEDTAITALTLVSVDTLVEVPAGSFHCYKYEYVHLNSRADRSRWSTFYCYAVNIGQVYSEVSYTDTGIKKFAVRSSLTSLELK